MSQRFLVFVLGVGHETVSSSTILRASAFPATWLIKSSSGKKTVNFITDSQFYMLTFLRFKNKLQKSVDLTTILLTWIFFIAKALAESRNWFFFSDKWSIDAAASVVKDIIITLREVLNCFKGGWINDSIVIEKWNGLSKIGRRYCAYWKIQKPWWKAEQWTHLRWRSLETGKRRNTRR